MIPGKGEQAAGRYREILRRAQELEKDIIFFLLELLRIPSFSGKEREAAGRIKAEMNKLGFTGVRIDVMGNVIGSIGSGPRLIAFDGHVDTVYPGARSQWSFDPFQPKVAEGRVWGRGAADQKGGLACMVYAARIIEELQLNHEFTVLFTGTVQEEDCEGLCWRYLVEEEEIKPELVVITEPTGLGISRGQHGRMEINVEVEGRSCHGSAPDRGDNAVYKAARVALEIEKLNERLKSDPFLGKGTVAVTDVASGSPSLCAVPDSARLHLDRRLTMGETRESAVAEVREAVRAAGYPGARITIPEYTGASYTGLVFPVEMYFPTWVAAADSPYLHAAAAAYSAVFGSAPQIGKWDFSTNGVGLAPAYGIPCIGFGPGEESEAHIADESCPVEHLSRAAAFYAALVARLNSIPG